MARTKNSENKKFSPIIASKIEIKKISFLKPYDRNARTHSETQLDEIAASIATFGFTNPILAQADGTIIAGHGRLEAATSRLELNEVPVIVLDHLTKTQARALVIADNKLALNAGWNEEVLAEELYEIGRAIEDEGEEFDLTVTGYDEEELDDLLKDFDLEEPEEDESESDESEAAIEVDIPVTALGDIWLLGNHRLICGDATKPKVLEKLLEGKKAAMVFTDPPYNMDFVGGLNIDGSMSQNSKHGRIANDKLSEEEAIKFFGKVNARIKENLRGPFYITFYRLGIGDYWNYLNAAKMKVRNLIIWDKMQSTLSPSDYKSWYEPIFYGWVGDHKFYGGDTGRDIWKIPRTLVNDLHPTMKPVALVEKALEDGSVVRDIVLDLFGGSGSTLIACENQKRHAHIIELEPKYCDVIVRRWQRHTKKKALLEGENKSFTDVKNERLDG